MTKLLKAISVSLAVSVLALSSACGAGNCKITKDADMKAELVKLKALAGDDKKAKCDAFKKDNAEDCTYKGADDKDAKLKKADIDASCN